MKKYLLAALPLFLFVACNDSKTAYPRTAIDAGRTFIRASLDGDFETAESLLMADSANFQLFDSYKDSYNRISPEKKKSFREASYEINKREDVNDSTTIINYSNSYMHKPMEIKVVKAGGDWRIDFKYTISGNLPIN